MYVSRGNRSYHRCNLVGSSLKTSCRVFKFCPSENMRWRKRRMFAFHWGNLVVFLVCLRTNSISCRPVTSVMDIVDVVDEAGGTEMCGQQCSEILRFIWRRWLPSISLCDGTVTSYWWISHMFYEGIQRVQWTALNGNKEAYEENFHMEMKIPPEILFVSKYEWVIG